MLLSDSVYPLLTVRPKVTNSLPLMPAVLVLAQPFPPQALLAAVPVVVTPLPRVSPVLLVLPVVTVVAARGEVP